MAIRQWSGRAVGAVWVIWPLVVTALLWGPAVVQVWRSLGPGDTVFLVAHPTAWLLEAILLIGPPLAVTIIWRRGQRGNRR